MIDVFSGHACQGSTQHDMGCFCSDLLFCLGLFLSSSFLPPLINQLNLTVASDHYFWHLLLRAPKLLPQLGFVGPFLAGVFHRHLGICLHQRARGGEGGQRAARSLIMEVSLPWLDARRNLSGGQGKTVFYRNFFTSFVTNIEAYILVRFNKETLFHCDGMEHQHKLPREVVEALVIYKNHLGVVLFYMTLLEQEVQPGDLQRLLPSSTIKWL